MVKKVWEVDGCYLWAELTVAGDREREIGDMWGLFRGKQLL